MPTDNNNNNNNNNNNYTDPSTAEYYSRHNHAQISDAQRFIDENGRFFQGPLLDIGCGTGEVTAYIANKFQQSITGVDISQDRINFANKHHASETIKFVVGDAACLNDYKGNLPTAGFATVVSFSTLHHLPKDMQLSTFSHIKKALKEDGIAVLLINGRSPLLHDAIQDAATSTQWESAFADFDLNKVRTYEASAYYQRLSRDAGFYHCQASMNEEQNGKKLDLQGMKDFLRGWLPHLIHLKTKILDEKAQHRAENEFLTDIALRYFAKMYPEKPLKASVIPKLTLNKLILYANKAAFFAHNPAAAEKKLAVNTQLRSHL